MLQLEQLYPALQQTLAQFGESYEYKGLRELVADHAMQLNRTEPRLVSK